MVFFGLFSFCKFFAGQRASCQPLNSLARLLSEIARTAFHAEPRRERCRPIAMVWEGRRALFLLDKCEPAAHTWLLSLSPMGSERLPAAVTPWGQISLETERK